MNIYICHSIYSSDLRPRFLKYSISQIQIMKKYINLSGIMHVSFGKDQDMEDTSKVHEH